MIESNYYQDNLFCISTAGADYYVQYIGRVALNFL